MNTANSVDMWHAGRWPIVASQTFILATRDTGYRNTAAAIAELIDNSLQANASVIQILIYEAPIAGVPNVGMAVLDDGVGMDPTVLRRALQFGGSERFNDRNGPGRFGMGLPNSSLSQSRRVEAYSWQRGSEVFFTFLDLEDIAAGRYDTVPRPVPAVLPSWVTEQVPASGTLIVWPACDKLGYRRVSTVASRLRAQLGRIYRYALWKGVRILVNGDNIEPVDPLLCRGSGCSPDAQLVGDTLQYEVRAPANQQLTSVVSVRFSMLPVAEWAPRSSAEKRRLGVTGRAGVSVVRASREIDYGWHLMGEKRKENYDDWWRCEVSFDPLLDEYFQVTHSKQGVTPHPRLKEMLSPDIERIARLLNGRVRDEFRSLSSRSVLVRGGADLCPTAPKDTRASRLGAPTVASRKEHLLPPLGRFIARYELAASPLPGGRFFVVAVHGNSAVVTLNTNHPFYECLYAPACASSKDERFRLECIVLAAARAELSTGNRSTEPGRHAEAWSDAIAAFVVAQ